MEQLCYGCMNKKTQRPICEHCGFSEVSNNMAHQLPIGMILQDQYVVGRVLGQGGFGITYIGWDQNLKRKIAIKEYFPQGMVRREQGLVPSVSCTSGQEDFQTGRKRFLMEAQTLAKLQDVPEIAKVYNFFSTNGTAYIVMEYVEGITLDSYVRQQGGKLDPQQAIMLLKPVMKALAKVHRAGIIHRDISPDNIMIQKNGAIRLLDFGTARDTAMRNHITQSPILKHGFAPMEQYQVNGSLGPWTDEYAVCATLYYCMTGYKPMEAPALLMDKKRIDWENIPGLSPQNLKVLHTATAMNTEDRYPNMEALLAAFERPAPPRPIPVPKPKRKWLMPAVIAVAIALLAAVLLPMGDKPEEEDGGRTVVVETEATTAPVQHSNAPMMMADNIQIEEDEESLVAPVFGSEITRREVYSITFLDSLEDVGADAWDISANGNGKIMAWVEEADVDPATLVLDVDEEETDETEPTLPPVEKLYNLYIAGDGGILAPGDCTRLFMGYSNLTKVEFNNCFTTEQTKDMRSMFDGCVLLTTLDVSGFNTSRVEDMNYMFYNCFSLEALDVSGFDTSNVSEMSAMFYECGKLKVLDVSNFDTSLVEKFNHMFYGCENLIKLDVRNFDTSRATNVRSMFSDCFKLMELDVSNFDTSNVENFSFMFGDCGSLTELNVSGFDTSSATTFESMFDGCSGVKALDVSKFDTSNVENFSFMFYDCSSVDALDVSNFDTSKATSLRAMFYNCKKITKLDVSGFNTANVTEINHMFYSCSSLTYVDVSGFNTSKATSMKSMFCDCTSLRNLDVSSFDTSNVTDMSYMFSGCGDQTTPAKTCTRWNVNKVTEHNYFMEDGTTINGRPWAEFFR